MAIVEVTDAGSGQTFEVAIGDEFVLRLSENPTTGFRWQVSVSGDGELQPKGDRFEPDGASLLPGAAGHRVLTFVASRAGTVTMFLVLRRAWEPSAETSKQIAVIVR